MTIRLGPQVVTPPRQHFADIHASVARYRMAQAVAEEALRMGLALDIHDVRHLLDVGFRVHDEHIARGTK